MVCNRTETNHYTESFTTSWYTSSASYTCIQRRVNMDFLRFKPICFKAVAFFLMCFTRYTDQYLLNSASYTWSRIILFNFGKRQFRQNWKLKQHLLILLRWLTTVFHFLRHMKQACQFFYAWNRIVLIGFVNILK